jgi:hypothetical protein
MIKKLTILPESRTSLWLDIANIQFCKILNFKRDFPKILTVTFRHFCVIRKLNFPYLKSVFVIFWTDNKIAPYFFYFNTCVILLVSVADIFIFLLAMSLCMQSLLALPLQKIILCYYTHSCCVLTFFIIPSGSHRYLIICLIIHYFESILFWSFIIYSVDDVAFIF